VWDLGFKSMALLELVGQKSTHQARTCLVCGRGCALRGLLRCLQQGKDEELMLQLDIVEFFAQVEVLLSLAHKQCVYSRYLFFETVVFLAEFLNLSVH